MLVVPPSADLAARFVHESQLRRNVVVLRVRPKDLLLVRNRLCMSHSAMCVYTRHLVELCLAEWTEVRHFRPRDDALKVEFVVAHREKALCQQLHDVSTNTALS